MRKIFYIVIILLFLVSNIGISIVVHYCSGTPLMSEITTGSELQHCEAECTRKTESESENSEPGMLNNDCCENDYITHKITDEFAIGDSPGLNQPITDFLYSKESRDICYVSEQTLSFTAFESPPVPERDLRKLHSSLII